jgi:hypothetical protein
LPQPPPLPSLVPGGPGAGAPPPPRATSGPFPPVPMAMAAAPARPGAAPPPLFTVRAYAGKGLRARLLTGQTIGTARGSTSPDRGLPRRGARGRQCPGPGTGACARDDGPAGSGECARSGWPPATTTVRPGRLTGGAAGARPSCRTHRGHASGRSALHARSGNGASSTCSCCHRCRRCAAGRGYPACSRTCILHAAPDRRPWTHDRVCVGGAERSGNGRPSRCSRGGRAGPRVAGGGCAGGGRGAAIGAGRGSEPPLHPG